MSGEDWKKEKDGFVLRAPDGKYIWAILANGHPEDPVIYKTGYLWEAKVWRSKNPAIKAAARIEKKVGHCAVLFFKYDEENAKRVIEPAR